MNTFLKEKTTFFKFLILATIIYMPVFGHLDTLPVRIWDESRVAINAYEMYKNKDYIVAHFEGMPDMWNTKPPLLLWTQVIFMKIMGVNELAIRLPVAIAVFFTCVILLIFSLIYLKNFWFGFIAIVVLITSQGYIHVHAARTGDYDAMLTLFTTASGLFFFAYCEKPKPSYLYLFFLCTALAVLTKSIAGLFFVPAMIIYCMMQKKFISLVRNKHFYAGLLSFLFLAGGYYLLREIKNPGYLNAVQENDLFGRYTKILDVVHRHGFWFYYDNLIHFRLAEWYLLVFCGMVIGLVSKNEKIKRLSLFSSLMTLSCFLIISTSKTQLEWYDVPMYPFMAILTAVFLHYLFTFLKNFQWAQNTLNFNVLPFVFLFLTCIGPYQKIINKTYKPKELEWEKDFYEIGYFLKDAIKGKHYLNNQYLLYDGYNAHNLFYLNILNDKGIKIRFKDWRQLNPMDVVIVCQKNVKKHIEDHYQYEVIQTHGNIITFKIHGKKEQSCVPEKNF